MRKLFGIIFVGALVSGCATSIPVNKEVGNLNLSYQTKEVGKPTNLVVAIVSPEFAKNAASEQQQNPYLFSADSTFDGPYKGRLTSAIQSTVEELFSKRGFSTKGPFSSLDDINYSDKKSMYLISIPKLTVNLDQKRMSASCSGMVCTENGKIQIGGELTFKLVEPLTGQTMLTKRIDLTSLTTSKDYIRQWQNRIDQTSVAGMIAKAQAPERLTDNTDRAMIDAINEFYQKAMTKLDSMLSREEILSFQADITQLKSLKRF